LSELLGRGEEGSIRRLQALIDSRLEPIEFPALFRRQTRMAVLIDQIAAPPIDLGPGFLFRDSSQGKAEKFPGGLCEEGSVPAWPARRPAGTIRTDAEAPDLTGLPMNERNQTVPLDGDRIPVEQPQRIGRYRIERILGEGGFGVVYLAHDEQLQRRVAVKVPHRKLVSRPEYAEAYLTEARTVANLDHPNIVPVHDIGTSEEHPFFIVSKFIEGSTLAQRIKDDRPSGTEAAELVATIADTLHYAHKQGIVHRDVKPGNILLDAAGKPFVADFGLALKEQDFGKGPGFAGTPAYMSPEQARSEGHRVDGRSDLFSLGVVFYELLTGRRPFKGDTVEEVLEQIVHGEVRPPRLWDDAVPKELERICLKALSRRTGDRYPTGKDLANDLRDFFEQSTADENTLLRSRIPTAAIPSPAQSATPTQIAPLTASLDQRPVKIVPKGLRSFDAHDADFFLELLPGPRDRDGLPDSIRFWKTRIEERDPDNTFSVGLIYGPSGCGKSSLVKAGLLPRLSGDVIPVYVEATAEETETRLLKGLRKRHSALSDDLGLKETLAALRRGHGMPAGKKVLIVLDQFEQWLHAKRQEENTELVQALRHCDGERLQCIVMVRDDFWMAATRFMRDLEARVVEAHNAAAVDLFPMHHAEKVLTAYGRAFGALPETDLCRPIDQSLQALVGLLEHLSEQYRELRDGVQKAIQVAEVDPEMALTRSRKVLEYLIRDVYERRIQEPPGTRPLENLLQRLVKDGYFPDRLDAYANTIRKLGNVGTHGFGEKVTLSDVHQSLTQLMPILEWYFEVERPEALTARPAGRPRPTRLSGSSNAVGKHDNAFLEQAVRGLAQDGKIICVRLALFAEMMKGKPWTASTLKEVGGAEGVGVTFLEETFSAASAPPEHRYHQKAARAVLKALLPESGTDIKGHMRSYGELLEASSYRSRPRDFDELIRILDREIRLITPTDPEGVEGGGWRVEGRISSEPSTMPPPPSTRFYQLTHDYLVPSLRDWLTRKQKETRRGRAELLLADRAEVWNSRPENRQLPSLLQWLQIRWLTLPKNWTGPQRTMMRKAARHHVGRAALVGAAFALLGWGGYEVHGTLKAHALVDSLVRAETIKVPDVVVDMASYRRWINRLLQEANQAAQTKQDARKQLHLSLALLPVDDAQVGYLYSRLLDAEPHEVPVVREALAAHQSKLTDNLWAVVKKPDKGKESQRLRAAAALAKYDPEGQEWNQVREQVVNDLVEAPAVYLATWLEAFRPVREKLVVPLGGVFRDGKRRETERSLATDILADYAADQPNVLADLLMDADEKQFAVLYPKFKEQKERGLPLLTEEADRKPSPDATEDVKEKLAKRQANAAAALLRLDRADKVWPLLKHSPDPRARSYLIHRLSLLGADPRAVVRRLDEEPEVSIRRALLLSLGEFGPDQASAADRDHLLARVLQQYQDDSDPGLHGAAEWLLRQWKEDKKLKEMNDQWARDKQQTETRIDRIKQELVHNQDKARPHWYVNGQGQTMVVIPGPVEFLMGSPIAEPGREGGPEGKAEQQHKKRIRHSFAMAAKAVTVEQFLRFRKDHEYRKEYLPTGDCPINDVTWYDAAAYCNWLSKQEGMREEQWCYLPNDKNEYAEGMKLAPDYLKRTGYRLPSEAEWEYACRAEAVTSRYYGETEILLSKYAWYTKVSLDSGILPVGRLKPNDLGLFDMLGNIMEWCQERKTAYTPGDDVEDETDVKINENRIIRGGSFSSLAGLVRSAYRGWVHPKVRHLYVGFRPARTFR
jgi:serine/threonine protein kinase/formylglycine-generating enzyme required for sulfatase activity/HEPN domain-containing protein